jgi:hypothetical protein
MSLSLTNSAILNRDFHLTRLYQTNPTAVSKYYCRDLQQGKKCLNSGPGTLLRAIVPEPAWGLKMKYALVLMGILFVAPQSAPANTPAFAQCGTYDSYILLYKSIQKFEELGKLHCGESLVITGQDGDFTQVRTTDGRLGWVPSSDLSTTAPPPQTVYTFGWTQKPKPETKSDTTVAQPASQAPEPAPVQTSVQTPVEASIQTPVATSVQTPAQPLAQSTVAPPVQTPAEAFVRPALELTVEPTVEPPAPTPSQPAESNSEVLPAAAPVPPASQPLERPAVTRSSESAVLLTNVNVMKMQGAHLSPDAIITRLNAARCDFDTSPAALHRLKQSGISDRIILAMMHAPGAFPALPPDGAASVEVKIPDQTPVQLTVSSDISSSDLQEGSVVDMVVVEPVTLNGVTVIPRGAEARARIMAVRRTSLGSSGQVVWFMQDITSTTGDRVPASFAAVQDAKATIGRFAGYPFFLSEFHKGAPAIAASSDHYTALVDGDIPLLVSRPSGVERSASKPQAQPQPISQVTPAVITAPVFPNVVQTSDPLAAVKP